MFLPCPNGSVEEVHDNSFGFIYKCQLPEFGYGRNVSTGVIEKTDIIQFSQVPEENFWQRPTLPSDYSSRRKKEKEIQAIDPYYSDHYLQDIRKREWGRRLRGLWTKLYNPIKKEAEWVYITGLHYKYITYWKFQGKHMDYRNEDRKLFYVVAYCMEDDDCLGLNEMTKRKNGKTARVGCWAYERVSRLKNHHAGLQSKSDDDAEEAFKKAVILPWQKLPDFFRPRYDLMKGEEPSELRFFATARRGSKAEEDDMSVEEPLESFFDFKPSTEAAYDGPELHTYVSDEAGKTKKPVSIKERQNVVRYCTEIDYEMKGKHWQTTTVEIEKGEEENYEFQELTANSNPLDRDENNRTGTGLYTYFLPAQKGMYIDKYYAKYGFANEVENLRVLNNTIAAYEAKGDSRGCSSFKRKNPRSFKEAFQADGSTALYNPELLNNQLDEISWDTKNHLTERGNLKWKDGHKVKRPKLDNQGKEIVADGKVEFEPSEVVWEKDDNGKFEKVVGWWPKNPNNVYFDGRSFRPNNTFAFRVGCDPFKYDKTKDKRRSNCASFVYQIPDAFYPTDFDEMFVLKYAYREESTRAANDDVLKMGWLCGCEILFERNINHWKDHFTEWNVSAFLMWLPGEVEPGVITATGSNGVQTICDYTESYINKNIKKVYFKSLIRKDTGWLGFKVEDTEKFDEPMGAGVTLVAVHNKKYRDPNEQATSLSAYFRRHKVA
jgi:hypothetical protein